MRERIVNEVTRRPDRPYLIESSPDYGKRRACLLLQRLVLLPVAVVCAAISGYRDELHHMRDATPNWWG